MATLLRKIDELLTLKAAAQKSGRSLNEKDLSLTRNSAMVVDGGHVLWIGTEDELKPRVLKQLGLAKKRIKEISLEGRSVLPSFVECHTHSSFLGDRQDEFEQRNQGVSYQEIAQRGGGILKTVAATRSGDLRDLKLQTHRHFDVFVRQGVGLIECKSGYGLDLPSEMKQLQSMAGYKRAEIVRTLMPLHALAPEYQNADDYVDAVVREILPEVAKKKLAERVDIFIEKGFFTSAQAERYFKAAKKMGFALTAHAEQLNLTNGYQTAGRQKAQSVDHLVCADDAAIEALGKSPMTCVLLPAADFYMKIPYPPARKLLDQNARVALATDFNPGTSPTQDLSFVGVLARLEMKMKSFEVLAAYTINAALALGRAGHCGSLEPGKDANFIVLNDSWQSLFYRVGYHPVKEQWFKGRKVFS